MYKRNYLIDLIYKQNLKNPDKVKYKHQKTIKNYTILQRIHYFIRKYKDIYFFKSKMFINSK